MIQNKTKEMRTMNIINKQNGRLCFVFAACIGLFSCTNDADMNNADGNVHFFASVDKPKSRVTESSWDGDELIGVKSGETVKIYKVAVDGTMSTDDTPFRWEGKSFDIQAWSPLTSEQINLTDQTTEEKFFDCDLLASSAKVEYKNVTLAFSHKMTRMWWELQKYEGYSTEEVNNAKIIFLGYGATTFTNGELSPIGDRDQSISTYNTWGEYYRNGQAMMIPCEMWEKPLIKVEIGNDTYVYTPSKNNQNDVLKKTGDLLPDTWQRYYLSVSKKGLVVDMESSVNWSESEDFNGENIADAKVKPEISRNVESLSGYQTAGLTNGLVDDNVSGFSISYTDTDGGGFTWEGKCDVERTEVALQDNTTTHTYKFSNIKSNEIKISYLPVEVGQYFYSNGTWGTEAEKEGLETLGRVFYAGKHSTDNSIYPGNIVKVRGYVVCTSTSDISAKWLENSGSDDNKTLFRVYADSEERQSDESFLGYKFTEETETLLVDKEGEWQTAYPLWYEFKNKSISVSSLSSEWYIPSVGQLKSIVDSNIVEGMSDVYWSSNIYLPVTSNNWGSKATDGNVWCMNYSASSKTVSAGWTQDPGKLILVLTF